MKKWLKRERTKWKSTTKEEGRATTTEQREERGKQEDWQMATITELRSMDPWVSEKQQRVKSSKG